jgi:Caspase domain
MTRFLCLAASVVPALVSGALPAAADTAPVLVTPPRPHAYAVVVGSNAGGEGQGPLRFAEGDAQQVAEVLREIGHFDPGDVRVLLHPDAAQVLAAIDEVGAKVQANAARGEPSEVVFYYSGHARATAVNLGTDELPLASLRARLTALPTSLTIVVLDACQSGAFARVKGAEPAADFSYNSIAKLTQKGLAVMASSSQEELSQESDELRGSYFTHHLVTALRGAGDADHDGRVSLDEAYRYAFRRTLASTARTQVGEQHVTLETDLAGQGDVPLTYPAEARAQIELPAPLDARVLLQQRPSGSVMADVQKAPGAAVRIAAVAGAYDAVVGEKDAIVECHVTLTDGRVTTIDPSTCTPVAPDRGASKGEGEHVLTEADRWEFEASIGAITRESSALTNRLENTFQYDQVFDLVPALMVTVGAARLLVPHVALVFEAGSLSSDAYQRQIENSTDTENLSAYGAGVYVRTQAQLGPMLGVYGQAGGGVTLGVATFQTQQTGVAPSTTTLYGGYLLGGAAGATLRFRRVPLTLFLQGGYDTAPAIKDLIGDTHDSGGFSLAFGVRLRTGDGQ